MYQRFKSLFTPHQVQLEQSLEHWLKKTQTLIESLPDPVLSAELQRILADSQQPALRLGVIGEMKSGKSSFINVLLDEQVSPVGIKPTTGAGIVFAYGAERQAKMQQHQGAEWQPFSESAERWEQLNAPLHQENPQFLPSVRISAPFAWLQTIHAELIDTPGMNNHGEIDAFVNRIVAGCDQIIMVVNAQRGLPQTDRDFLLRDMVGRTQSRVLIAVSFLDQIPQAQRATVMESIRHRLPFAVPVLALFPEAGAAHQQSHVRHQVQQLLRPSEQTYWHNCKVIRDLANLLGEIISICKISGKDWDGLNQEQRTQKVQRTQNDMHQARAELARLQQALRQRQQALLGRLHHQMLQERQRMLAELTYSLDHAQDPHGWWNTDLKHLLEKALVEISQICEPLAMEQLAEDSAWLSDQFEQVAARTTLPLYFVAATPHPETLQLVNINRWKLLTHIGTSAAFLISSIFVSPLILAAYVGWQIGCELYMKQIAAHDRDKIRQHIEPVVDQTLSGFAARCQQQLEQTYATLLDAVREHTLFSRSDAFPGSASTPNLPATSTRETIAQQAQRLQNEMTDLLRQLLPVAS